MEYYIIEHPLLQCSSTPYGVYYTDGSIGFLVKENRYCIGKTDYTVTEFLRNDDKITKRFEDYADVVDFVYSEVGAHHKHPCS